MSLVFLKSADDKQDGRYNPNKPYRFSNYLTNPITIPPNSQVSYVSSQFLIDGNGIPPDEPSWFSTGDEDLHIFEMPVLATWNNAEARTTGGWREIINRFPLSANEFGMDGDLAPLKYITNAGDFPQENSNVAQADFGFRSFYDSINNIISMNTTMRSTQDQFNLTFNCIRGNPSYLGSAWIGGGGATVPAGLNFTDKVDPKFQGDTRIRSYNSPNGASVFAGGNCFGVDVDIETNNANARPNVYAGGANYYNTGFSATQLNQSPYDIGTANITTPIPSFNEGNYGFTASTVGVKKCVGDFTPSNDPQQSNGGGHQTIGHLESGGYAIYGATNIRQAQANGIYTATTSTKEGFTGWTPQFVGLHSIPYIQQRGFDEAVRSGVSSSTARDFFTQTENWLKLCDLNKSSSATEPEGGDARYLIGLDILPEGNAPNVDLVARPKILDTISGTIRNSKYKDIGISSNGLSFRELSKGINTACNPPYQFSTDEYSINTYNTDPARIASMLFFRFRWVNKNQIDIEFTLSVDGYAGTYNNYTDEPYAPAERSAGGGGVAGIQREVRLTDETNGSIENIGDDTIDFFDSGGAGAPYDPNQAYDIVFVAKENTNAILVFNEFEFEQSGTLMYDRLGIQTSNDGVIWTNIAQNGFQRMNSPLSPQDSTDPNDRTLFNNGAWDDPESNGGWVLPRDLSRFSTLGGGVGIEYNFGARYVKFKFISDGNPSELGWNIQLTSSATLTPENDPRDRWCLLGSMTVDDALFGNKEYYIPTFMGDMGLLSYPLASSFSADEYRMLTKGYYDVRQTNRYFQDNNNGGLRDYAPFSSENPYFAGFDSLGVWVLNESLPTDPDNTSQALINVGYDGSVPPSPFNNEGLLDCDTRLWLGSPIEDPQTDDFYRKTNGLPAWLDEQPRLELAYIFGLLKRQDPEQPVVLDVVVDPTKPTGIENAVLAPNEIDATNEAFSNHVQITNLPIQSSSGVVSSVTKTIYIVNSLCIHDIHDTSEYRYYCHQAPNQIWIDLNNYESIQLNKLDVLIAQDNNTEQKNLIGESQIVIMFRQKEQGILPNTIQGNSTSMTRTY